VGARQVPQALLAGLLLLACRSPESPALHFCREEVNLRVRPGTLEVAANYHFQWPGRDTVRARISYPFPLDSVHGFPDSVAFPGRDFELADSSAGFWMRFLPQSEDSFLAWYRQPLRGSQARYIVTTTRRWERPIDLAQFRVEVPTSLHARLNYRPDSTTKTDSTIIWHFACRDFWPSEDVTVTWHR
jgi:hypothetical protein